MGWGPFLEKNFNPQNDVHLTQLLTGIKHRQSLEALGRAFYGSIAKRSSEKKCKNYQKKFMARPKGAGRSHHRPSLLNTPWPLSISWHVFLSDFNLDNFLWCSFKRRERDSLRWHNRVERNVCCTRQNMMYSVSHNPDRNRFSDSYARASCSGDISLYVGNGKSRMIDWFIDSISRW